MSLSKKPNAGKALVGLLLAILCGVLAAKGVLALPLGIVGLASFAAFGFFAMKAFKKKEF